MRPALGTIGRRKRSKPQSTGRQLVIQPRDAAIVRLVGRFTMLRSDQIFEDIKDTWPSAKGITFRFTALFHEKTEGYNAPLLTRLERDPRISLYSPEIYLLSKAGRDYLLDVDGTDYKIYSLGDHSPHLYMQSQMSYGLYRGAKQHGVMFRNEHDIFKRDQCKVKRFTIDTSSGKLSVDGLVSFAREQGVWVNYALEADRGTKEYDTEFNKLLRFDTFLKEREFELWGLNNIRILYVTSSPSKAIKMRDFVKERCMFPDAFYFKVRSEFGRARDYPKVPTMIDLYDEPWITAKGEGTITL